MAKNRQQLDLICEHIDKLYAYISQMGAQIATLSEQLQVCQDNCYALYQKLENKEEEKHGT